MALVVFEPTTLSDTLSDEPHICTRNIRSIIFHSTVLHAFTPNNIHAMHTCISLETLYFYIACCTLGSDNVLLYIHWLLAYKISEFNIDSDIIVFFYRCKFFSSCVWVDQHIWRHEQSIFLNSIYIVNIYSMFLLCFYDTTTATAVAYMTSQFGINI